MFRRVICGKRPVPVPRHVYRIRDCGCGDWVFVLAVMFVRPIELCLGYGDVAGDESESTPEYGYDGNRKSGVSGG
ncbi:hypothetical protein Tco_0512278 [Tanacetum coccineum]